MDSGEGRDGPGSGERHLGNRKAAVHHYSLDRLNMINDSPQKWHAHKILSGHKWLQNWIDLR